MPVLHGEAHGDEHQEPEPDQVLGLTGQTAPQPDGETNTVGAEVQTHVAHFLSLSIADR